MKRTPPPTLGPRPPAGSSTRQPAPGSGRGVLRATFGVLALGLWMQTPLMPATAAAQGGRAAELPDPTRPPPASVLEANSARLSGREPPPPEPATAASAAKPVRPTLQALRMVSRGRPTAMIDGQLVRVGDRIGEMQVQVIDHLGVTLRTPEGPLRLALLEESGQASGTIVIQRRTATPPAQPAAPTAPAPVQTALAAMAVSAAASGPPAGAATPAATAAASAPPTAPTPPALARPRSAPASSASAALAPESVSVAVRNRP